MSIASGWSINTGVDADFSRTTTSRTGEYSQSFLPTSRAYSPELVYNNIPVTPGNVYMFEVGLRADSIAAGNTITAKIVESTPLVANTYYIHNAVLSAANTWEVHTYVLETTASAYQVGLYVAKAGNAFTGIIDYFKVTEMPQAFCAYRSAAKSIGTGTFTKIDHDAEDFDHGSNFDTSSGDFTAPYDGRWFFSAAAAFDFSGAATDFGLSLYVNGTSSRILDRYEVSGAGRSMVSGSCLLNLDKGDVVDIGVIQSSGGSLGLVNDLANSYFSGHEVR